MLPWIIGGVTIGVIALLSENDDDNYERELRREKEQKRNRLKKSLEEYKKDNIDYIYISHQNNPSLLDPSVIEDSIVRIFIKLKDINSSKNKAKIRTLSLKKSIHINVESKEVSNFWL